MLVVDAINERAAAFYEGNGFLRDPQHIGLRTDWGFHPRSVQLAAASHAIGMLADSDRDGFRVPSWSALSICALGRLDGAGHREGWQ
jgi:hypothetical protein